MAWEFQYYNDQFDKISHARMSGRTININDNICLQ